MYIRKHAKNNSLQFFSFHQTLDYDPVMFQKEIQCLFLALDSLPNDESRHSFCEMFLKTSNDGKFEKCDVYKLVKIYYLKKAGMSDNMVGLILHLGYLVVEHFVEVLLRSEVLDEREIN